MSAVVTFAQAQERAERWINGGVQPYQRREVQVREFDLGFVAWAEDSSGGGDPSSGGRQRLVIARDSGIATLWPGLPVGEVIRRYEEEYGAAAAEPVPAAPPKRVDLEATSFLLTPPEWLQEAADQLGIPDRRTPGSASAGATGAAGSTGPDRSVNDPAPAAPAAAPASPGSGDASQWDAADTSGSGSGVLSVPPPTTVLTPSADEAGGDGAPPPPRTRPEAETELLPEAGVLPETTAAPALDDPGSVQDPPRDASRGPSHGVPQGPPQGGPGGVHHAATMLADSLPDAPRPPGPPGPPGAPQSSGAGSTGGVADAETGRAPRGSAPSRGGGPSVPPPPGAPGVPGARSGGAGTSGGASDS
ncbi:MAG TPA: hypothetical protein VFY14_19115, partial [Streptomyces sp.]|nr:hypothetical protein [Streptomyces sp.]